MVRSLVALGFNEDESGKAVFDGAYPHIGGGLMPLNVRFGQAYRAWGEQTDHTYPAYEFPFTYGSQTDPLSGRTGGLLDRCQASGTCPKIFHVATVLEVWEGRQSLGLTDPLGRQDFADPANVRTYIMASTQHSPAGAPYCGRGQQHVPAAIEPQSAGLDDAGVADGVDGVDQGGYGAAAVDDAADRGRDAGGGRSGAVSADPGE